MAENMSGVEPARDYDQMVDWDKRLARERPFFRDLFESVGVRRVIDVGCGSGKHAIMFSEWGLEVIGIDPNESMLLQARENAAADGADVRFVEGGFGEIERIAGTGWDAVTTLGNGLPHVDGAKGLASAVADFAAALRPGGVAVLHLLNHARLIENRIRMMPAVLRETPEGDRVFLKVIDYVDGGIMFDFVTLTRDPEAGPSPGGAFAVDDPAATGWHLRSRRSVHTALPIEMLLQALKTAGFDPVESFGDHMKRPLSPNEDESVIVVARRSSAG